MLNKLLYLTISIVCLFPLASGAQVEISSISQNAEVVGQYEKFELTFTLSQTYSNPFDPCIADVRVSFHGPDGNVTTIPAFYFQDYVITGSNPERYTSAVGPELWKARYAPSELGVHSFDIIVTDLSGTVVETNAGSFTCQESDSKGFISIDANDSAFMCYDNGQTRLNIGHHIGWSAGEVYSWNDYITKMHLAGENWTRLWMCRYGGDGGVILEWKDGTYRGYFHGAGKLSMQTALRLDSFVEIAEQNDIAIQLTLLHHGLFSTTANPDWNDNPYNIAAGGFLEKPEEFFTDVEARRLTKNKFRYIVARWGYSTAILSWELWNEVQFTNGWNTNRGVLLLGTRRWPAIYAVLTISIILLPRVCTVPTLKISGVCRT